MPYTNQTKNTSSYSNQTKNTASYSNQNKSGGGVGAYQLKIDSTYSLLIESPYNLLIQASGISTSWSNQTKN